MEMIADRLPFTVALSVVTLLFTYAMAIPKGD
jgi:ABC-type dipeptide/oligopeptide/nickel transport system permease component